MKKIKKCEATDVLWLMMLILLFIVVAKFSFEYTSTETLDTYAKNIVNREAERITTKLSGFSTNKDNMNMFRFDDTNSTYVLRDYSAANQSLSVGYKVIASKILTNIADTDTDSEWVNTTEADGPDDNSATAVGIAKFEVNKMKYRIIKEFSDIDSATIPSKYFIGDITPNISLKDKVVSYKNDGGPLTNDDIHVYFKENNNSTLLIVKIDYKVLVTDYQDSSTGNFLGARYNKIPRYIVVTRNIENVKRFK